MPYSDPAKKREASKLGMRRYYARHREKILARQREQRDPVRDRARRRAREELVRQRKGSTCSECGGSFASDVLHWHHRDPATKVFNPSHANRGWEALEAEMAKCDVLCTDCHGKRHRGRSRDAAGRFQKA